MFDCPTCDRHFETRRGLGVHHSCTHGTQLPNRTCAHCSSAFHSEYEKKYCSKDCLNCAVSFEGKSNPNYRGGKTQTTCEICNNSFEFYPSEKPGLYCSDCVDNKNWRERPNIEGENNGRWKGGKLTVECTVCAEPVERYPSNIGDVVACSERCRRQWLSEEFTGEGHPNWRGGGNAPYGKGWATVRAEALERDGYQCVHCGTTRDELGRNPDVHHIVPVRAFIRAVDYEKTDAHTLENVVSLCITCHRKAEFGHIGVAQLCEDAGLENVVSPP